ncbi:MAG: uracil-DNA glycosylase [Acidobacteriota bacterium]|nr:uracil-DNA glycosylase [Acidobacteriota bacterium]
MTPIQFVEALRELSLENTFNPYSERCVRYDRDDAPQLRCTTLHSILEAAAKRDVDFLWIGRDPGHRGGRRTGLAFTDDVHLHEHAERWGLSVRRPTRGEKVSEQTATVIWRALSRIESSVFLWNVFPLHPHRPGNPFSNRPHTADERRIGEEFLDELIRLLRPRRLVAIGNDAAKTARRLVDRRTIIQVRHPSHGGQTKFLTQIDGLHQWCKG